MTAVPGLLSWLDDPSENHGIRFAARDDTWDSVPYARLADSSRRVAAALLETGVGAGDTVGIVSVAGPDFVAAFFGALIVGAGPAPMAPPGGLADAQTYPSYLRATIDAVRPRVVLHDPFCRDAVTAATGSGAGIGELAAHSTVLEGFRDLGRAGLVQSTSGSGGVRKAVRISLGALAANVAAIRAWLGMRGDVATASWLPVHHDMGLVGCLLTPIADGSDLALMTPAQFVHRPLRYLREFAAGAGHTAMPAFGLAHILRRVPADRLDGLDLRGWRSLIVGAERIDAGLLDAFAARLAPCGFDRRALLPSYGLAEATLAVTGLPLPEPWSAVRIDAAPAVGAETGPPIVGCGRPLTGVTVTITGEDGQPVPDGTVGEIVVAGPSVADGYLDATSAGGTRFDGELLHTADAGFLRDGQLYVLGRLGDSLKVRGRTVFAEDVEGALVARGVPRHRLAALLGARDGLPTAVVVMEKPDDAWITTARTELRRLAGDADTAVISAPARTIVRTSSGKPRRRELWNLLITNRLGKESK